jgi:hypothetical protein
LKVIKCYWDDLGCPEVAGEYSHGEIIVRVMTGDIEVAKGNPDAVVTAIRADFFASSPYLIVSVELPAWARRHGVTSSFAATPESPDGGGTISTEDDGTPKLLSPDLAQSAASEGGDQQMADELMKLAMESMDRPRSARCPAATANPAPERRVGRLSWRKSPGRGPTGAGANRVGTTHPPLSSRLVANGR